MRALVRGVCHVAALAVLFGVGKIFAIGRQKMNGSVHAYCNAVKPDNIDGPDWTLRLQLQFLFPK